MDELLKHFAPSVVEALAREIDARVSVEVEKRVQEFKMQTFEKPEACRILGTSRHGLIKLEKKGWLTKSRNGRKVVYTREALNRCLQLSSGI